MNFIQAVTRNLPECLKAIDDDNAARIKAGRTAVKIEAFRLRGLLQKEIRAGAPGGVPFAPLSEIAKRITAYHHKTKPLLYLARPVRYNVTAGETDNPRFTVEVGFAGNKISKSWLRIAAAVQEEQRIDVTETLRRKFILAGKNIRDREKRKYFFVRKETTTLRSPARQIIDPFWDAHKRESFENIQNNFARKLRGERI